MLNIAGIVCLFVGLLSTGFLLLDLLYNEYNLFQIITDIVEIVISFATAITFLILAKKEVAFLIKNKKLFLIIVLFNIFNNIIAWFVCFWVEMSISQISRVEKLSNLFENTQKPTDTDENVVILDESEYEVQGIVNNLKSELERLEGLKKDGLINQTEYEVMRKELINKYFN